MELKTSWMRLPAIRTTSIQFDHHDFIVESYKPVHIDFNERIKKLPYIFKDPLIIDKKIDPKKLQFGSKINRNKKNEIEYYHIKRIINPELIELSSGQRIKLIGIKSKPGKENQAVDFLRRKTKGERVFLKFDETKHDSDNNLYCYLYLKNKTFINAHLVKSGFVDVDSDIQFKHKERFLNYLKVKNG